MGIGLPDEATVWAHAIEGDSASFGAIFDAHRDRVYAHAMRLLRRPCDAEDATALVSLEAWRRRSAVRLVDGSIAAWLLVTTNYVARNLTRTHRRYNALMAKAARPEPSADHADAVLERMEASEREARVRTAFTGLTRADQDILTLCVLNDFSLADAAQSLNIPVGTVKSRLSRAKRRLSNLTGRPNSENVDDVIVLGETK